MKRVSLGVAAVTAALALAGGAATAHNTSLATTIAIDGNTLFDADHFLFYGHLESSRANCLKGRTVKLLVERGGETMALDTDRSSRKGAWAVISSFEAGDSNSRVKVTRKNIGPNGHHHVCKSDSAEIGG